jgi:hemolysin activation/secretion protein
VLSSKVDSFLFTTSATKVLRREKGIWVFSGSLSLSPGEINGRNSLANFREARLLAKARYATGTVSLQRLQALGGGWELSLRALAQFASANLLSNEQLNLGGASTVRGFAENVSSGDEGFTMTTELLSPTLRFPLKLRPSRVLPLDVRGLLFSDAGKADRKTPTPYDPRTHSLSSLGAGVRISLDRYLSITADYGWQLVGSRELRTGHQRLHLRATLSY